jgi:hypothetical protein
MPTHRGAAAPDSAVVVPATVDDGAVEPPLRCVSWAASGRVEITVTTPGCFGVREGLALSWQNDRAFMRSISGDRSGPVPIPRAALVGFVENLSDRALSWQPAWEACHRPLGHLGLEARWTCVDSGGRTMNGYSATEYPLCSGRLDGNDPPEASRGEAVKSLVEGFDERWRDGPPRYMPVALHRS